MEASSSAPAGAAASFASGGAPDPTAGSSGAAAALSLLLREDPLLVRHGLTSHGGGGGGPARADGDEGCTPAEAGEGDGAAHAYAASLLRGGATASSSSSPKDDPSASAGGGWTAASSSGEYRRRATEALAEVDRELALVESLAQRVSRESPEEVAGPLLRLHGFELATSREDDGGDGGEGATTTTKGGGGGVGDDRRSSDLVTLAAARDKADRLARQAQLLDGVARRVESALARGATRMESATTRLSRVLDLSATLKMAMRLQFEARKVLRAGGEGTTGFGLDLGGGGPGGSAGGGVDLRDLTRAAASVAAMEGLLAHPSLRAGDDDGGEAIDVVEHLRPPAEAAAESVREAAAGLLDELQSRRRVGSEDASASLSRLGATLQVYFHLGELPDAAWRAASSALAAAEKASSQLFHPAALKKMGEAAAAEARSLAEDEVAGKGKGDGAKGGEKGKDGKGAGGKDALPPSSSSAAATATTGRQRKKQLEAATERLLKRKLREKRAAAASKWTTAISDAASRAWNLHRVLARRNDPASRRNFLEVVSEGSIPPEFRGAEERLLRTSSRRPSGGGGGGGAARGTTRDFSLFSLFWTQLSIGLGGRVQRLLRYDGGSLASDVAALFPAVRSASLDAVAELCDAMQVGRHASPDASVGDASGAGCYAPATAGAMGGSAGLEDSMFLGGGLGGGGGGADPDDPFGGGGEADEAGGGRGGYLAASADAWTRPDAAGAGGGDGAVRPASSTSAASSSAEWKTLRGEEVGADGTSTGLWALRRAFLEESKRRLRAPLERMFPEAVTVDEDGVAIPVPPTLPSRYDLAKLDACVREELSLADPRQGGGDFGMAATIGEGVVEMLSEFCGMARRAIGEAGEERAVAGSVSEATAHNMNVAGVMSTLASFVRNAPENAFVAPYRPAQSPQHEEAARSCRVALLPALKEIDALVRTRILDPLCRALNRRVAAALARMHRGTYLQESADASSSQPGSFVQVHLADLYDDVAASYLSRLPNEYAAAVASTVATFSVYAFVSNAALLRPLGEASRLRLTQDLADFELALEQLVFKGGTSLSLGQIAGGKPYAELRAARQLLFWSGLDDRTLGPAEVARALLRDAWAKDLRPSTLFHFLFSYGPSLLTSPHHFKRTDAGEYVGTLVKLDGSVEDGEASAWMTTMACCDAYQQRESVDGATSDGDRRVGAILMVLGPELLRRRRQ
ncbi:hypothetical protein ACHAWF_011784 [Thalassiosira exigua]